MKKFFTVLISVVLLAIAGYGISYLVRPAYSVELEEYRHEVGIHCAKAYIVRDESVYYATTAGTVYNISAEGNRVPRDTAVASIYDGNVDTAVLREIRTIDNKINRLKKREAVSTLYSDDAVSVESDIAGKMSSIYELAQSDSVEEIHEYREDINTLRSGGTPSISEKIAALENERTALEGGLSAGKADVYSSRTGIFSSYIDGLESVLSPDRIAEYDAKYLMGLQTQPNKYANGTKVEVGDPVCKIMNNHVWYVLGIADKDRATLIEENKRVTVRFSNLSGSEAKGTITYISEPDEEGTKIFMIEVQSYLESAFSYRNIDADVIFDEYSGYKIPNEALRTGETINSYYVYASKGSDEYKCDVDVLYTDIAGGFSIIQSAENAQNSLGDMERLIVGDR